MKWTQALIRAWNAFGPHLPTEKRTATSGMGSCGLQSAALFTEQPHADCSGQKFGCYAHQVPRKTFDLVSVENFLFETAFVTQCAARLGKPQAEFALSASSKLASSGA